MVDRPNINPQVFAKRASQPLPTLATQIPNLRATARVTSFADNSIADTLVSMADDATRLQMLASDQFNVNQQRFDKAQKAVEEDQLLEAEALYGDATLAAQNEIRSVRENAGSIAIIPEASLKAFDEVVNKAMTDSNLSAFQRRMLQRKFDQERNVVAQKALEYQANLRKIERENNIKKATSAATLRVVNDPSRLEAELENARETLTNLGVGGRSLKASLDNFRVTLTEAAVQSGLRNDTDNYARRIRAGEFDEGIDGATKIKWLDAIETEQNKNERDFEDARDDAQQARRDAFTRRILTATSPDATPEQKSMMPSRQEIIASGLSGPQMEFLINMKDDQGTDDPQFLAEVRRVKKENPQEALDMLEAGLGTSVTRDTFLREEGNIAQLLQAENRFSPLAKAMDTIESMENEVVLNKFPTIAINVQNAKDELAFRVREYDELKPDATPAERNAFIRTETRAVLQENFPRDLFNLRSQIPAPYGFSGVSSSVDAKALQEAKEKLFKDEAAGRILPERLRRESEKLLRWEEQLKIEEQVNGTVNRAER